VPTAAATITILILSSAAATTSGEGEDIDTMWLVVIGVGAVSYVTRYNSACMVARLGAKGQDDCRSECWKALLRSRI
jgi:hypothetical protein